MTQLDRIEALLERIADALEVAHPRKPTLAEQYKTSVSNLKRDMQVTDVKYMQVPKVGQQYSTRSVPFIRPKG